MTEIFCDKLSDAVKSASSLKEKEGGMLEIVLFGAFPRGALVDEPHVLHPQKPQYPSDIAYAPATQGPPGCHVIPTMVVPTLAVISGETNSAMNAINSGRGSGATAIVVRFRNARH